MANYSINANLPGVKKLFTSEQAAVVGSSTLIPMLVVALHPDYMQDTLDGYVVCETNTSTTSVVFTTPSDLKANELAGEYVFVSFPTPEVRQISANTGADAGSSVTVTVSKPYSAAPSDGHSANIRRWEDFKLPSLHSSLQGFAEKYIAKNSAGQYQWTYNANAYYTVNEAIANGSTIFYVCPVAASADSASELVENLNPTSASAFTTRMLQLSPQPDLICVPKQPSHLVSPSASQWATVDAAWTSYVVSRATNDSSDDQLREMVYVADSATAVSATSVTYRTSDWNPTSERATLVHGHYNVSDLLNKGSVTQVSLGPAVCGMINRISTGVPESYGHAFEGRNFSQIANLGLVEDITLASRLTLQSNGVNPLISKPGQGSWMESQYTMAKSSSDVGADPLEHLHVVVGRAKIWNTLQPVMESVLAEPNNPVVRQGVLSRMDAILGGLLAQGIIAAYSLVDVTSDLDVTSGTARFELRVVFNREIDFIELKLTAAVGQGG